MPMLTNQRHELFAQQLAAGKSMTDAYTAAGYPATGNGRAVNSSRLQKTPEIRARVEELQSRAPLGVMLTKQWVIERLMENVKRAMTIDPVMDSEGNPTGQFRYDGAVANRALELLGKEKGMFVDRKEVGEPGAFDALADDELYDAMQREAAELGIVMDGSETAH